MKTYTIRKLIKGFKIGPRYAGMDLVACKSSAGFTHISYKNKTMEINTNALTKKIFKDKFGRGTTYKLAYYEWLPDEEEKIILKSKQTEFVFA